MLDKLTVKSVNLQKFLRIWKFTRPFPEGTYSDAHHPEESGLAREISHKCSGTPLRRIPLGRFVLYKEVSLIQRFLNACLILFRT